MQRFLPIRPPSGSYPSGFELGCCIRQVARLRGAYLHRSDEPNLLSGGVMRQFIVSGGVTAIYLYVSA